MHTWFFISATCQSTDGNSMASHLNSCICILMHDVNTALKRPVALPITQSTESKQWRIPKSTHHTTESLTEPYPSLMHHFTPKLTVACWCQHQSEEREMHCKVAHNNLLNKATDDSGLCRHITWWVVSHGKLVRFVVSVEQCVSLAWTLFLMPPVSYTGLYGNQTWITLTMNPSLTLVF